jgi:membrane protease YdiL (CAAX protease family)
MKRAVIALTVVGIWIAALVAPPQMLGSYLWSGFEYTGDLPLDRLLPVALNAIAVLVLILITRRPSLLVPERPRDPRCLLLLAPLASVNLVLRGPLVDLNFAFLIVAVASTFLTAFWEEFLFRGLIQDRLSVLGCRMSWILTAVLFSLVHNEENLWSMLFAFSVGLTFSALRERVGLWALVLAHWAINATVRILERPTWTYIYLATAVFMVVGVVLLATTKKTADSDE